MLEVPRPYLIIPKECQSLIRLKITRLENQGRDFIDCLRNSASMMGISTQIKELFGPQGTPKELIQREIDNFFRFIQMSPCNKFDSLI
jgi:hypothetical protein